MATKTTHGPRLPCPAISLTARATELADGCIHPSQVAIVNEVFSPSEAELEWAKRVSEAFKLQDGRAVLLDGKMLDIPVYLRAERILSKAGIEF